MAHDILGNRFATRNAPAWHGLGKTFIEPMTATEAVRFAGLDFNISKRPLFTPTGRCGKIRVPDMYAIVRAELKEHEGGKKPVVEDRRELVLGTCTDEFEVISNLELAALVDPLAERYPVETVGALANGARTFFCLLGPESSEVDGDEIKNYFTIVDSKVPGKKAKVFYSPVRVVCQNTLTMGEKGATISFDIAHRQGAQDEFRFYTSVLTQMAEAQERTLQIFRQMAFTDLKSAQINETIDKVFAMPTKPQRLVELELHDFPALIEQNVPGARAQYDRALTAQYCWSKKEVRMDEYRRTARELVEKFNDEHRHHANTVWAVYNALTEVSDWRKGKGKIAESVLFGERAQEKERAFTACTELLNFN